MAKQVEEKPKMIPNRSIRRRLFSEGEGWNKEAAKDNSANVLQEMLAEERKVKYPKWNFDFEKEEPLPGDFVWYKKDRDNWIAVSTITEICNEPTHKKNLNEQTPKCNRDDKTAPPAKKKKYDDVDRNPRKDVKKKINFDKVNN